MNKTKEVDKMDIGIEAGHLEEADTTFETMQGYGPREEFQDK